MIRAPATWVSTTGVMNMKCLTTYRLFNAAARAGRAMLLGALLLPLACDDEHSEPAMGSSLRGESFMLVHGAWNGAWVWDDVKGLLEAQGARVRTVTLPGHAEDTTPVTETSLGSYVDAVLTAMEGEEHVTLVGHSFGGVVISLTAEREPKRIKSLIYIGAFLPQDGETALDLAQTDTDSDLGPSLGFDMDRAIVGIDRAAFPRLFCADCSEVDLGVLAARYSDEPLPPLVEPIELSENNFGRVPKYYVYTEMDRVLSPAFQRRVSARVRLTGSANLQTSHSPFFAAPQELVATLDELLSL